MLHGIISQGGPGCDAAGSPKYRGDNGSKCALGWLIPDELYTTNSIHYLDLLEIIGRLNTGGFYTAVFKCHDLNVGHPNFMDRFKSEMKEIARIYELNYSEVIK